VQEAQGGLCAAAGSQGTAPATRSVCGEALSSHAAALRRL
jgi:hypothetical protein